MNMENYLQFVAQFSNEQKKVFILDTGEGNDFIDPKTGWHVEDFSGWLVDPSQEKELIDAIDCGSQYNLFKNEYVFAKWHKDKAGEIAVRFVKY
jgi:hypothetical protein